MIGYPAGVILRRSLLWDGHRTGIECPNRQQDSSVKPTDIPRVQAYLRKLFANKEIHIDTPKKAGATVEVRVGDEFIGTLHRDDDEGEVSFAFQMVILEDDLPPAASPAPKR